MSESPPIHEQIITSRDQPDEYDKVAGEKLAKWCFELLAHAGSKRKKVTRESNWESDWDFIKGNQWTGPLPSYRRPIVMNAWKRALHIALAIVIGNRPILKLIPTGNVSPQDMKIWQDAFWSIQKTEYLIDKYADALCFGWVNDGGWIKIGYGRRSEFAPGMPDVLITAPHPAKVYVDPDCTDMRLIECGYVIYRDVLDLSTISRRYPEQADLVEPDGAVSTVWSTDAPEWTKTEGQVMAPAGGWRATGEYHRAKCTVAEVWIDDSTLETRNSREIVNTKDMVDAWSNFSTSMNGNVDPETRIAFESAISQLNGETPIEKVNQLRERLAGLHFPDVVPEVREKKQWRAKYPYGRIITCTPDVVLRDIPNDAFGKAWGWENRYGFVYVPGAHFPACLHRPGLLSNQEEMQRAVNKSLSLLIENAIKVTNMMVVADENAMEDEDWDNLSLVPGVKIRKRPMSEFKVEFPKPLPPQAFQLPDYLIKKLEEPMGLHDPPIAPGQSVSSKTVAFMQQKGSFLMGMLAKLGEEALERIGHRIIGLQVQRYLPGREVPMFDGEKIVGIQELPDTPASTRFRVEATSGFQEILAMMEMIAQQQGGKKPQRVRQ